VKIFRKLDLVYVSALLLCSGSYVLWHLWKALPIGYRHNLEPLKECLLYYLEQNAGVFPSSEEELLQKGFLKIENSTESERSYIYILVRNRNAPSPEFRRCFRFRNFTIKYNTQYEDLQLLNGRLVDKRTNQPVLLINGPCRLFVPYRDYSIELYRKMSEMKKKNESL